MLSENKKEYIKKIPKKITSQRLKNIALYYLKRFETSSNNLRLVLRRRIDNYCYYDKSFDKFEAYTWVETLIEDFVRFKYIDDERFAEIKIRGYLAAGKSVRYIVGKLREKGIEEDLVMKLLSEQDYDPVASALKLVQKKKIGPYSVTPEIRKERRSKDLAILMRAGFDYDVSIRVLDMEDVDVVY